jgi:hypothetical protein
MVVIADCFHPSGFGYQYYLATHDCNRRIFISEESNKDISRLFWKEFFGREKLDLADEIIPPDFSDISLAAPPGLPHCPEGSKMLVKIYRSAFPDLLFSVEEQIAEGDRVTTYRSARGTHWGDSSGIHTRLQINRSL